MKKTTKTAAQRLSTQAPRAADSAGKRVETPLKPATKIAQILAMLSRKEGATLDQIVAATGWLPHTARAALTGLRKKGHAIASSKAEGPRIYRVSISGEAI
jgi:Fic family protein